MFLAPLADMVKEASYEVSESIRQVITLQASGADVFLVAAPKIRRAGDPQILRPCCLEHSALPQLCVGVDRNGAQAGRTRQVKGTHIDAIAVDREDPCHAQDPGDVAWKHFYFGLYVSLPLC